jgi:sugar phosphate isomerase/epimerase
MNLSYTTLSVPDKTMREAVEIARRRGLEGIELRGKENAHISPQSSWAYVQEAKKLLRTAGLAVPCLSAYTRFFQESRELSLAQAEELLPMLHLAADLGASVVRTFMGPLPEGMGRARAEDIAAAGLNHAAELARDLPVKIVIETHDSVKNGAALVSLLAKLPEKVGVLLDIIHPWDTGESIETTLELIGKRIYHVHIKDIFETLSEGRVYSPIGQGRLEVRRQVETLLARGYKGFFSLEWEKSAPGSRGVSFNEQLESFVSFMRSIIGGLNHANRL